MNSRTDNKELTGTLPSCRNTLESQDIQVRYFERILKIPSYNVHNISYKNPAIFLAKFIKLTKFFGLLDIGYENSEDTIWFWDSSNRDDLRLQIHNDSDRWISNLQAKPTITAHYDVYGILRFLLDDCTQDIPHDQLIQEVGSYVQHLRLTDFNKKVACLSTRSEDKEKHTNMLNGKHLEALLGQCPSLKSLILNSWDLIGSTNNERVMNESLQELSFSFCKLNTEVLTDYSARLPNLKALNLSRNSLTNSSGHRCKIHMPRTSFDSIFFFLDAVDQDEENNEITAVDEETMPTEHDQQNASMDDMNTLEEVTQVGDGFEPIEEDNEEIVVDGVDDNEGVAMDAEEVVDVVNEEDIMEDNAVVFDDDEFVMDDDEEMMEEDEEMMEEDEEMMEEDEKMMEEDEDMDGAYTVDGDETNVAPIKTFYVKLKTDKEEEWFYGDENIVRLSSSEEYHSDENSYYLFDIECRKLVKLIVEFYDRDNYQKCEFDKVH